MAAVAAENGTAGVAGCAAAFEAADPPRAGQIAFWGGQGDALPAGGERGEVTVVVADGDGVQRRTVPAVRLPIGAAVPLLVRARRQAEPAHPATRFWGAVALVALDLVARGRVLPGVTAGDVDAWRVGPLERPDLERVADLAAAMPAEARAVPLPGDGELLLPAAHPLIRAFLDAVADVMPRTAAAPMAAGCLPYAAVAPQQVPELRQWADGLAAGIDAGVRISLRLEIPFGDGELAANADHRAVVQVHNLADPAIVLGAADLWRAAADRPAWGPRARIATMVAVRRAAQVWAPLEQLLTGAVPDEVALDDADLADLLGGAATRLAAAGVEVHWPKELVRELTAHGVVGHGSAPPSDLPAWFGSGALLSFDWQLALGGESLTEAEMNQLAEAHRPIVRLRDQWVLVDPDLARRSRQRHLKPLTAIDALGAVLTGTVDSGGERVPVAASGWLDALRARIREPDDGAEAVPAPAALAATLREYQLRGLRWLARMTSLGLGGCLADDMGLGKTVTLIALHLHRRAGGEAAPTLVVCPASLLGNWEREIQRFAPGEAVRRYHGPGRSLDGADGGFVLTTYATMRLDAGKLAGHPWGLLVADEAQHVKNPSSGTARALRTIPAAARVALTGTPVENNLSELWAILDWTTPGLLGTLSAFRSRWATPIEADRTGPQSAATAERLARLVRPFLLRRRKSDPGIAPELPAKTETDQPVALTPEQAGLYEAVVRETMAQIRASRGIERRGLVLKLLTALKQICNHPAHYLKESPGDATTRLAGRSGKLELLDELVDTVTAEDGAVLVFTQYVAMGRLIARHLTGRGVAAQLLHGGTPVARREEMVRQFQAGAAAPVFVLSLKAAGTGLNLTRADHVIHYDRWWNPAVEDQATDRAYRIGQTKPVQVHRLIAEGTVEDVIATMLAAKRDLADAVLTSGEAALTELTDDELAELVTLRSPR